MIERLRAQLGDALETAEQVGDEVRVRIKASALTSAARFCKEHGYTYPCDITAMDAGSELRMIYRLYSPVNRDYVVLTVGLPRVARASRLCAASMPRRIGWSVKSSTCSGCGLRGIPISSGFF